MATSVSHQSARDQPSQPSQGEPDFGDSSGPLFSIYSKAAEDDDNEMVERWQKDADGILILSHHFGIHISLCVSVFIIDGFILCCSRRIPCRDGPGPEAKLSGYLRILPWQHLPGSYQSKRNA